MKIQVKLFRFGNGKTRVVEIPSIDGTKNEILEQVFHYGQNMVQPQKGFQSVSVGDVIFIGGERWIVKNFGFGKLDHETYEILEKASKISNEGPDDLKHRYDVVLYNLIGDEAFKLTK